jgi:hypothetical protein
MTKLEENIIGLFALTKVSSMRTWRMANLIYFDCMNRPDRRNGARVSAICRSVKASKYLKLEGDLIHFKKEGWPDK